MAIPISDITIIAVGVDTYTDTRLRNLNGPKSDIKAMKSLLVEDKATALFKPKQFIELQNPTSEELRTRIDQYALDRSARGDAVVFYFSGHGVSIGNDDFGFCTSDSRIHEAKGSVLPLSVLKFSELIRTFIIANAYPVIIIDACHSGAVGRSPLINPIKALDSIKENTVRVTSDYCLLCSCSDEETVKDTTFGGVFSKYLLNTSKGGVRGTKKFLSINDIFPLLNAQARLYEGDITPILQQGPGLPEIPFVKNVKFSVRRESLGRDHICVLRALWNKGRERELSPDELGQLCGRGAYSNHSKLSLEPWKLVEDSPKSKGRLRRLTNRGRKFIAGEIRVPKRIIKDTENDKWFADKQRMVYFKEI